MVKKILVTLLVLFLSLLGLGAWQAAQVLSGGSGYAAKNICSGVFISGMTGHEIVQEALIGASPLLANTRFDINREEPSVTANLWGFLPRTATYSEAHGCTLQVDDGPYVLTEVKPVASQEEDPFKPWPFGTAPVMTEAALDQKLRPLLAAGFAELDVQAPRNTKAIVVVHKGELIAEQYADGIRATTPLLSWSMAKSVTSLLLGTLVLEDKIDINDPAPIPLWLADERAKITTDVLLRMSSGLVFDEEYGLFSDVTHMLSSEANMGNFAADKPLMATVDSHWSYSSGTSNIVAKIIRETIGSDDQTYYDYLHEKLLAPLDMSSAVFEVDAGGTQIGSSYFYATARDWAKLGLLCLQHGAWQGKQLIPEDWIEYSTTPTSTSDRNLYGAHFWLNRDPTDASLNRNWPTLPVDAFAMSGFQGQQVVMIPSRDLVVVRLGFTPGANTGVEELIKGILDVLDAA